MKFSIFMRKYYGDNLKDASIEKKYSSQACKYYRDKLLKIRKQEMWDMQEPSLEIGLKSCRFSDTA